MRFHQFVRCDRRHSLRSILSCFRGRPSLRRRPVSIVRPKVWLEALEERTLLDSALGPELLEAPWQRDLPNESELADVAQSSDSSSFDTLLVQLKCTEAALAALESLAANQNATVEPTLIPGLVKVHGDGASLLELQNDIAGQSFAYYAAPEQTLHASVNPNDPFYA